MENEFVPYELALKLKQLGFDKPCFGYYQHTRLKLQLPTIKSKTQVQTYMLEEDCSAPLFQQAFRWFREKHNLKHHIWVGEISTLFYGYDILNTKTHDFEVNNSGLSGGDCDYDPYERAELACLEKLIEIVESKQEQQ